MLQETFSMKSLCLPSQHCCPWNQTKALRKCEFEIYINIKIEQIQHKRFLPGLSLHLELDNKMQRPVPAQTQQRPGHRQLGLKNATQLGRCVQAARQPGSQAAPHLGQIIITMSVGSEWRRRFVQTNISGQTSSVWFSDLNCHRLPTYSHLLTSIFK